MLKVTETSKNETTVTLRLDGKLVDDWVRDLENICLRWKEEKKKTVVLDFSGIIFVSSQGVKMLERIKDERVDIINYSPFIKELLGKLIALRE